MGGRGDEKKRGHGDEGRAKKDCQGERNDYCTDEETVSKEHSSHETTIWKI